MAAVIWNTVGWLAEELPYQEALAQVGQHQCKPQARLWEVRIEEIDRQLAYNLTAARAGAIDIEVLTQENEPLLEEKAKLRRRLLQAAKEPENEEALRGLRQRGFREDLAALPTLPIDRQLVFLGALFAHVELHRGYLRLVWQHPDIPALIAAIPKYSGPERGCRHLDEPHFEE